MTERDATATPGRLVRLEGNLNFRDLGGYRTAEGRTVRWGRVYRSDHTGALSEDDIERLHGLGIRSVFDLRGPHELEETPSRFAADPRFAYHHRPVGDGTVEREQIADRIRDGRLPAIEVEDMAAFYLITLDTHPEAFHDVVAGAADPERHAIVFHCTAGKDRTGLAAALILGALGVDDEQILDDYELTNHYRSQRRLRELRPELAAQGIDVDRYLPFFTAQRPVMARALVLLRERWGSIERYLTDHAGLDRGRLAVMREHLLE